VFAAKTSMVFSTKLSGSEGRACLLTKFTKLEAKGSSQSIHQIKSQVVVHLKFSQSMPVRHGKKKFHDHSVMRFCKKPLESRNGTLNNSS